MKSVPARCLGALGFVAARVTDEPARLDLGGLSSPVAGRPYGSETNPSTAAANGVVNCSPSRTTSAVSLSPNRKPAPILTPGP